MIFLKHFSGLEQIAFYSVSYSLTNNLLLAPRTFGGATSVSLMAEASRTPPGRVDSIVKNASRYLLLVSLPIHVGAAAIAGLAVTFTYGAKYAAAVPVLVIASLLAIPRAFQELPETLLRAADRQKQLLVWYSITGVLNIALDFLFIPRLGAVGAAWGNGLAQAAGVVFIWFQAPALVYLQPAPPCLAAAWALRLHHGVHRVLHHPCHAQCRRTGAGRGRRSRGLHARGQIPART